MKFINKKIKKLFFGICVIMILGTNTSISMAEETASQMMPLVDTSPESDFVYSVVNDTYCHITGYSGSDEVVVIPSTLGGYVVQAIKSNAFAYCTFTEIDIPDTVNYIGPEAFLNCTNLEKLGYPAGWNQCYWFMNDDFYDGYTYNKSPFIGCSSLKEITVDEGVTSIPKYAFRYFSGLEKINLPTSLTKIEAYAFDGCTSLKTITVPDAVTEIEHFSFAGCSALDTVTLSGELKKIGNAAFIGCTSLKEITIPYGVAVINETVFKDCASLYKVVLPNTVEVINSYAFENCPFTEIDIPDSIYYIGPEAFLNCKMLKNVGYPAGWSQSYWFINDECYDGYAWNKSPFISCSSLKEITVDEGVTSIPKYAFRGCDSLEKVNLPESLTMIKGYTFDGCTALKTITVPDGVTTIEHNVFAWCGNLEKITLSKNLEQIGFYVFNGCSSLTEIVLPCDKLNVINDTGIVKEDDGFVVVDTDNTKGLFTLIHSYQDGICSCGAKQEMIILDVMNNTIKIWSPTSSAENDTVTILLASYLDDELVGAKFVDIPVTAGTNDYTVTGFESGDCDTIRAFVWDDFENLMPLCKCYDEGVETEV